MFEGAYLVEPGDLSYASAKEFIQIMNTFKAKQFMRIEESNRTPGNLKLLLFSKGYSWTLSKGMTELYWKGYKLLKYASKVPNNQVHVNPDLKYSSKLNQDKCKEALRLFPESFQMVMSGQIIDRKKWLGEGD